MEVFLILISEAIDVPIGRIEDFVAGLIPDGLVLRILGEAGELPLAGHYHLVESIHAGVYSVSHEGHFAFELLSCCYGHSLINNIKSLLYYLNYVT